MEKTDVRSVDIPVTRSGPVKTTAGRLYGSGPEAVIFSNMDTNDQNEWAPIVNELVPYAHMILTYDYVQLRDDQSGTLEDAIAFVKDIGAERVILIGASRGGVASVKVASRSHDGIIGIAAISAPIEYEGTVFYSSEELGAIKVPKLLINSEHDEGVNGTRRMFEIVHDPKEMLILPGNGHGTEIFADQRELLVNRLKGFIEDLFS
jgi:pimeloyl-ACP methyl ester carboxylesterase